MHSTWRKPYVGFFSESIESFREISFTSLTSTGNFPRCWLLTRMKPSRERQEPRTPGIRNAGVERRTENIQHRPVSNFWWNLFRTFLCGVWTVGISGQWWEWRQSVEIAETENRRACSCHKTTKYLCPVFAQAAAGYRLVSRPLLISEYNPHNFQKYFSFPRFCRP